MKQKKKKPAAKKAKPATPKVKKEKPLGAVTHFFGGINVAIVKCKAPIAGGARLRFRGATTDFAQIASSMQYDHEPILRAKKGQEIGIKVSKRVREGDLVYLEK